MREGVRVLIRGDDVAVCREQSWGLGDAGYEGVVAYEAKSVLLRFGKKKNYLLCRIVISCVVTYKNFLLYINEQNL